MLSNTLMTKKHKPPPPPKPYKYPSVQPPSVSKSPSLGRVMMEGAAFGTGSSIARESVTRTINAVTAPVETPSPEENRKKTCQLLEQQLQECFDERFFCDELFEKYMRQCSRLSSIP